MVFKNAFATHACVNVMWQLGLTRQPLRVETENLLNPGVLTEVEVTTRKKYEIYFFKVKKCYLRPSLQEQYYVWDIAIFLDALGFRI